ncbi:hypothetical protein GCM10027174_15190 [Salinifilum aidingensis]
MFRRHERRQLEEIERRLISDDPDLARRMSGSRPVARVMAWMTMWRALGVLAGGLAVLCLFLGAGSGFLVAGMLAGVLLIYARWRDQGEQGGSSMTSPGGGVV